VFQNESSGLPKRRAMYVSLKNIHKGCTTSPLLNLLLHIQLEKYTWEDLHKDCKQAPEQANQSDIGKHNHYHVAVPRTEKVTALVLKFKSFTSRSTTLCTLKC
jgi:hypothetical protein